jgi:hypothetical protein
LPGSGSDRKIAILDKNKAGQAGQEGQVVGVSKLGYIVSYSMLIKHREKRRESQVSAILDLLAFQKKRMMRPGIKQAVESLKQVTQLGSASTIGILSTNCGRQKCGIVHNKRLST